MFKGAGNYSAVIQYGIRRFDTKEVGRYQYDMNGVSIWLELWDDYPSRQDYNKSIRIKAQRTT